MYYNFSLLFMLRKHMYGIASITLPFFFVKPLHSYMESKKEIMQLILIQSGSNKHNIFNTRDLGSGLVFPMM